MKLMVLDGNSIVNRAFYGVRQELTNKEGFPTNAIYGFLNILMKLIDESAPDALCVTFDLKAPTFRHEAYEGYKATRKGMPDELARQMPVLKEILDAMNIPRYELEGWEADDLIGTITVRDAAAGWDTLVVTGDKDSLQLVNDRTTVLLVSTRMGQTTTREMNPQTFFEEYGFTPEKMVDLKALMGDSSDNIPGVPGIGEKTAMGLVQKYGTVKEIYKDLDAVELKPAARRKMEEGKDMAAMSYDLATIRCDAPIDFAPEDALRRPVNNALLYEKLSALDLRRLIERLGLSPAETGPRQESAPARCVTERVENRKRAEELLEEWEKLPCVAVLPLPTLDAVAVAYGCSLAFVKADALGEDYPWFLRELFSEKIGKTAHDVKTLMGRLLAEGLPIGGFTFDTAIAAYLIAPTDGSYELDKLYETYFSGDGSAFPSAKAYLSPDAFAPLADAAGAEDALFRHAQLIFSLREVLEPKLEEMGLTRLFREIELPLCPVLARMELTGFKVDRGALRRFGEMLTSRIDEVQKRIYAEAGREFNLNSPKQLGEVLFEDMGIPAVKKTKSGYSTNADVLEKLRGMYPIVGDILDYRQLAKLNSTYVEGLTKVIAPDGRIHTSFQNTVTATGRLSSTEPNLQNIPVRTELGAEMRNMFVAEEGWMLVDADYSQIELRLLSHIADDKAMIDAFLSGTDIHTVTASQVFGVKPEEVTHEMRRRAKAVNFGIVYGISEFSLAGDIHVSRGEAREYMDRYFSKYSGVAAYMNDIVAQARRDGYVTTLYGRRRPLPELKSSNFNLRSFGERVALNTPIQGTAADIMKLAMLRVDSRLRREGLKARLVLQVHDELIVECPEEETEHVKKLLTEEMEGVAHLSVPLTATSSAGKSWGDAKE